MFIRDVLKKNLITGKIYGLLRNVRDNKRERRKYKYHGNFVDRSKGNKYLVIILAGYKPYLYSSIFGRIKEFLPENYDVCVITSGLFSNEIDKICEINQWSYLSTKENNVGLVQNIAISLHKKSQYIFKLDEDIFITKDYFDTMIKAFKHANTGDYNPGVIAPIININGFSYRYILDELNLTDIYKVKFEPCKKSAGQDKMIQNSTEVAQFFWGEGEYVPSIDDLNSIFQKKKTTEIACPIRFSIGAILFDRQFWEQFGGYSVDLTYNSLGKDEEEICSYCLLKSRPIMVSLNCVVGHFSFGPQTEGMKEYYDQHPEKFLIQDC